MALSPKDKAEYEAPKVKPRVEPEDEAPKAKTRASKEVEEVNEAEHLEPYPTGNPPDPMEAYDAAHPERSVDWGTYPPEGPPPPPEDESRASRTTKKEK